MEFTTYEKGTVVYVDMVEDFEGLPLYDAVPGTYDKCETDGHYVRFVGDDGDSFCLILPDDRVFAHEESAILNAKQKNVELSLNMAKLSAEKNKLLDERLSGYVIKNKDPESNSCPVVEDSVLKDGVMYEDGQEVFVVEETSLHKDSYYDVFCGTYMYKRLGHDYISKKHGSTFVVREVDRSMLFSSEYDALIRSIDLNISKMSELEGVGLSRLTDQQNRLLELLSKKEWHKGQNGVEDIEAKNIEKEEGMKEDGYTPRYSYGDEVFAVIGSGVAEVYRGTYVERSHGELHIVNLNDNSCVYVEDRFLYKRETDAAFCAVMFNKGHYKEELQSKDEDHAVPDSEQISGIWEVPYVCEMGVEKHCRLILNLIDEEERRKVDKVCSDFSKEVTGYRIQQANNTLHNEMADLYLILKKYFSLQHQDIPSKRAKLFESHGNEDVKYIERIVK